MLLSMSAFAIAAAFHAPGGDPMQYAFITHARIADESDGSANCWPCVALLDDGRILAVWARRAANAPDDAIVAAVSRDSGCTWTPPNTLIAIPEYIDADPSIVVSGPRVFVSCTAVPGGGISTSTQWFVRSEDNGETWTQPYAVPFNHRYTCGKTHRGLRLASGALLLGYSWETNLEESGVLSTEGQMDLRAGVMRSTDNGDTWTNGGDTHATFEKVSDGAVSGTDEPALVQFDDGSLYMLMRTGASHLYEARSSDEGLTWRDVKPSPLIGSNAPAALAPFTAGDRKGIVAVWNNSTQRVPLSAAASFDGGVTWTRTRDIAQPYPGGQASYPSCVQTPDGALLAVWQQDFPAGRAVRMARFSLPWLLAQPSAAPDPATNNLGPESPATERIIVALGDSTTAPRGPLLVYPALLQTDLAARGIPVRVINAGLPGDDTGMARQRFQSDVLAHNPGLVLLSFGINDSAVDVPKGAASPRVPLDQYEANLHYFIAELRKTGAVPVLFTPNPLAWTPLLLEMYGKPPYDISSHAGFNLLLDQYAETMRRVAAEERVPLVDTRAGLMQLAERAGIENLLLDGMHPNDTAHRFIADRLLECLLPLLSDGNADRAP